MKEPPTPPLLVSRWRDLTAKYLANSVDNKGACASLYVKLIELSHWVISLLRVCLDSVKEFITILAPSSSPFLISPSPSTYFLFLAFFGFF